jgi:hypothetical protein
MHSQNVLLVLNNQKKYIQHCSNLTSQIEE